MKACKHCGSLNHSSAFCRKPRAITRKKTIKNTSKTKKLIKKPVNRSKVKKKLEKLVKDYIKLRDNYICQKCGKKCAGSDCHASHVLNVGSHSNLQFEPLNLKVLCSHCHIYWWHKDPLAASDWFKDKFPDRYEYLMDHVNSQKITTVELQEMIKKYSEIS